MKTIYSFIVAMLVALIIVQSVVCEENQQSDILDIPYPATFSGLVTSDPHSPMVTAARSGCTNHICQRLCVALYYKRGRCVSASVCRCTR